MFIEGSLTWWNKFKEIQTTPNAIFEMADDGTIQTPSQIRHRDGLVEINPDQTLILEFDTKDEPTYWSWVLQNVWGRHPIGVIARSSSIIGMSKWRGKSPLPIVTTRVAPL